MTTTLHQFAFSHFNEKVRWALAYKNIPYTRETYLPGPHMPAIRKLSGQSSTPVLECDGAITCGSSTIIEQLERDHPEPSLYPADPELRDSAIATQADLDAVLGPAVRTLVFSVLVNEAAYLCNMFAGAKSLPKRLAYRATFPLARGMIAKGNGVTPDNIVKSTAITQEYLDRIAAQVSQSGHMVGDTFTVADLTASALLAPIANVEHVDMRRPQPLPDSMQLLLVPYRDHPAMTWVNQMYSKYRP